MARAQGSAEHSARGEGAGGAGAAAASEGGHGSSDSSEEQDGKADTSLKGLVSAVTALRKALVGQQTRLHAVSHVLSRVESGVGGGAEEPVGGEGEGREGGEGDEAVRASQVAANGSSGGATAFGTRDLWHQMLALRRQVGASERGEEEERV
jgi:hypothetical protein